MNELPMLAMPPQAGGQAATNEPLRVLVGDECAQAVRAPGTIQGTRIDFVVVDEVAPRTLKKIPRSNLRAMTAMFLKQQGGLCPLCGKPIDLTIAREGVVDHDHHTGEVRGVLHRGCNGAEGKVANSVGRWAGTGMDYAKIIPWLENLLAYLKREGTGWMYPTHKTAEEKALAARLKRRTVTAQNKARIKVRSMKPKEA